VSGGRLDGLHVELVLPAGLVNPHAAKGLHEITGARDKTQSLDLRPPHHAAQGSLGILECQVEMSGLGLRDVRHFTGDPHILQLGVGFQPVPDQPGQLGNRDRAGRCAEIHGQLVHPARILGERAKDKGAPQPVAVTGFQGSNASKAARSIVP
jgi:hypothetical protein